MNLIQFVMKRRKWSLYYLHKQIISMGIRVTYNSLLYSVHNSSAAMRPEIIHALFKLSKSTPAQFLKILEKQIVSGE